VAPPGVPAVRMEPPPFSSEDPTSGSGVMTAGGRTRPGRWRAGCAGLHCEAEGLQDEAGEVGDPDPTSPAAAVVCGIGTTALASSVSAAPSVSGGGSSAHSRGVPGWRGRRGRRGCQGRPCWPRSGGWKGEAGAGGAEARAGRLPSGAGENAGLQRTQNSVPAPWGALALGVGHWALAWERGWEQGQGRRVRVRVRGRGRGRGRGL